MSAKPCRGCGKPVVFAKDTDGKWQVLDAHAPIWIQIKSKDSTPRVMREPKAMVSHFATCANANDFSASRKAAPEPDRSFSEPQEMD